MRLRLATPSDGAALARIYAPSVQDSPASFELVPPDAPTMGARVQEQRDAGRPWLVAEQEGAVMGYAYAGAHRSRLAYQWGVETSVYLAAEAQGRGLGTTLMTSLLSLLEAQGYALALAGVTLPNPASLALHGRLGFEEVARYPGIGFKDGAWHDVWWGQRRLGACRAPLPPVPTDALSVPERMAAGLS